MQFRPYRLALPLAAFLAASLLPRPSIAGDSPARARPAASSPASTRAGTASSAGKGWRIAPPPAWVVRHEAAIAPPGSPGPQPARDGWHALLVDQQRMIDPDDEKTGHYVMLRTLVTDSSGLGTAGRVQVSFDPTYEKVLLHAFAVWRDGHRLDRLANARIELLRREAGLEREALDGRETLLVLLQDVRVGDVVEMSYSVLGHNPVHGPAHDGQLDVAFDMPVDRLFTSVASRSTRRLHVSGVRAGDLPPVRDEGGVQRWEQERSGVAGVQAEDDTPSDYAVYPHVAYTDDADWHEVSDWGVKLFAVDPALGGELEQRLAAWRASGLQGTALVSAALGLVQDEVRYFSASLGENSHRPKVPARTWADRAGDCKDKTALLVAILQRLGFDAKPALVSTTARGSLQDLPPGHGAFDHAIVRLRLDGRTWWLDGTRTDQSTKLETRAAPPVAWALVVAPETRALEAVQAPPPAGPIVRYDHVWDTSDLSKPARLTLTVEVRDATAEAYRGAIAAGHLQELLDNITAHYGTRFPDYHRVGEPVVADDRVENRLSVHLEGEVGLLGDLQDGATTIELYPLRIMDLLATPSQVQRTMPWSYEPASLIVERIRLVLPVDHHLESTLKREVADPHFALTLAGTGTGHERVYDWRFERRNDVVLPSELARFREKIAKARSDNDFSLQMPLYDNERLKARIDAAKPQLDQDPRMRGSDELAERIGQAYGRRVADDLVLARSGLDSRLGRLVQLDRVAQDLLLGEDDAARADLDRLPAEALEGPAAQYTRGLVLFTSGRFADAEQAFRAALDAPRPQAGPARRWMGIAAYHDARLADAVRSFREAVQEEAGDERAISLVWLFLAAQRLDQHGEAAIASFLPVGGDADPTPSSRLLALLRDLAQKIARKESPPGNLTDWGALRDLTESAKKEPRTARERGVQTLYFLAQVADVPGDRSGYQELLRLEAQMHTTAVPEDLCARTELRRAERRAPTALLDEARRTAVAGDRGGAATILQRAIADAPDDADALLALTRVEVDQGHCTAVGPGRRAASLRPDDPAAELLLARAMAPCDGDRALLTRVLGRLIADAHAPDTVRAEALAQRAIMASGAGDFHDDQDEAEVAARASALQDAQAAARLGPTLLLPLEAMFRVHEGRSRFADALADADRMDKLGAPVQVVDLFRGIALHRLARDEESEAALTRSLAVEPGNRTALFNRSQARLEREDLEGALRDAQALVAASPERSDSWGQLKAVRSRMQDYAGAREALDQQIRLRPEAGGFRAQRAELDEALDDLAAAVLDIDRAVELRPGSAEDWTTRARLLWLAGGRDGEILPSCMKALALEDTLPNRAACAFIAFQSGDHDQALVALEALLGRREEMFAKHPGVWFGGIGSAFLGFGRGKDAAPFLRSSLEMAPSWAYGAVFLYLARAQSGDEPGARAELEARRFAKAPLAWPAHLIDYALRRIDDDALRLAAKVDAPGDFAGQACEAAFYMGMRHWIDGDVAGGRRLLAQSVAQCPRAFNESAMARAWLAAGPGATAAAR